MKNIDLFLVFFNQELNNNVVRKDQTPNNKS